MMVQLNRLEYNHETYQLDIMVSRPSVKQVREVMATVRLEHMVFRAPIWADTMPEDWAGATQ